MLDSRSCASSDVIAIYTSTLGQKAIGNNSPCLNMSKCPAEKPCNWISVIMIFSQLATRVLVYGPIQLFRLYLQVLEYFLVFSFIARVLVYHNIC